MSALPKWDEGICRRCFESIRSVLIQDTSDGVRYEWRHANPEHDEKWGIHRPDLLITGSNTDLDGGPL